MFAAGSFWNLHLLTSVRAVTTEQTADRDRAANVMQTNIAKLWTNPVKETGVQFLIPSPPIYVPGSVLSDFFSLFAML